MQSRSTKVAELSPEASGCCVRCRVVAVIVAAQMGSGEAEAVSCSEVLVGDVSANPHTRDLPRQNPDCPLRTPTAAPCLYVRLCWQRSDVMYRWCTAPGGVPFSKLHQLALTPGAVFKWLGSFRELAWHQHVAYNWATWQETGCISMMLVGDQMELLLPGRSAPGYVGFGDQRARDPAIPGSFPLQSSRVCTAHTAFQPTYTPRSTPTEGRATWWPCKLQIVSSSVGRKEK